MLNLCAFVWQYASIVAWLSTQFKQALFVYKVLRPSDNSTVPCRHGKMYQINPCWRVSRDVTYVALQMCFWLIDWLIDWRHLRSAAHGNLVELRCRTTRYGKQSFLVSAPLIWNSLPTTVRNVSISMTSLIRRLKAELFRRAYGTDLAPMWQLSANSLREHKYSYLLTYNTDKLTVHDVQVLPLPSIVSVVSFARTSVTSWTTGCTMADWPRCIGLSLGVLSLATDPTNTTVTVLLVQALISSRLDCCNSVLYGITETLTVNDCCPVSTERSARLITRTDRRE